MNIVERNKKLERFTLDCLEILEKKGSDYNPDGIAFSEIRKEAEDLGLRPEQVMLVLAGKHWGAIKTYVKTQKLATEPIRERLKDLANYCALMAVMLEENEIQDKAYEFIKDKPNEVMLTNNYKVGVKGPGHTGGAGGTTSPLLGTGGIDTGFELPK